MIADANVLVRAVVQDDRAQAQAAINALKAADAIVIPTTRASDVDLESLRDP